MKILSGQTRTFSWIKANKRLSRYNFLWYNKKEKWHGHTFNCRKLWPPPFLPDNAIHLEIEKWQIIFQSASICCQIQNEKNKTVVFLTVTVANLYINSLGYNCYVFIHKNLYPNIKHIKSEMPDKNCTHPY